MKYKYKIQQEGSHLTWVLQSASMRSCKLSIQVGVISAFEHQKVSKYTLVYIHPSLIQGLNQGGVTLLFAVELGVN
jgi:hypothetical protein